MRKFFLTILAFVYIISCVGATIHMHYCMGKLADWNIVQSVTTACEKCGMEKKDANENGCCKDEKKYVKYSADQKTTDDNPQYFNHQLECTSVYFIELPVVNFSAFTIDNSFSNSPPGSGNVAIYLRNCVFLI